VICRCTAPGGYAEYTVVDEAYAYAVPEVFGDEEAAPLLCAGIIGYRALIRSNLPKGGTLGIFGFGQSAHLMAQIARSWGCTVYVVTRGKGHQDLARRLGAAWASETVDGMPGKVDGAIIFAPAGELVPAALAAVAKGGTVVCAGIHMTDIPSFAYELLWHERTIRSVANLTRQDGIEFLELARRIPVRTTIEVYELARAEQALDDLRNGRFEGSAVIVP